MAYNKNLLDCLDWTYINFCMFSVSGKIDEDQNKKSQLFHFKFICDSDNTLDFQFITINLFTLPLQSLFGYSELSSGDLQNHQISLTFNPHYPKSSEECSMLSIT